MAYKWKPSKSARREFAEKMANDTQFASDYYARKTAKENKRRSTSSFDYHTAGGNYIPTKEQHDFCMANMPFETNEQNEASNQVMYGYVNQEKIQHDYIHIINELRRKDFTNFAKGGKVKKEVDLFVHYELQPKNVAKILDNHFEKYGDSGDYKDTEKLLKQLEAVGYTFDYYLDNEPYGLRKKGVNLNELEGFEDEDDDDMAKGGKVSEKEMPKHFRSRVKSALNKYFKEANVFYQHAGTLDSITNDVYEKIKKDYEENNVPLNRALENIDLIYKRVIEMNPKMAKGGKVEEKLDLLNQKINDLGIYTNKNKDVNGNNFIYVKFAQSEDSFVEQIDFVMYKNGKIVAIEFYYNVADGEKVGSFNTINEALDFVKKQTNLLTIEKHNQQEKEYQLQKEKEKKEKNEWISPLERVKKYGFVKGGNMKNKLDLGGMIDKIILDKLSNLFYITYFEERDNYSASVYDNNDDEVWSVGTVEEVG